MGEATGVKWAMPYDLREQPKAVEDVILHFGVDLRSARRQEGESQSHLGAVAHVSQGVISMVENGLAEGVRLEMLARLAAALGFDITVRRCAHPPGTGWNPPSGRALWLASAEPVPGTRRLERRP
jgi:transcriptional regulator with XRE-family HTH domain